MPASERFLDPRRDEPLDRRGVRTRDVGFPLGHSSGEEPLSRKRELLRQPKDVVVGVVDAERLWRVPRLVADHGIVVGGDLGWLGLRGGHAVARRLDVGVVVADLRNDVGQQEPLRRLGRGRKDDAAEK